jgi:DNA-binding NarL/FixJ family response regulator
LSEDDLDDLLQFELAIKEVSIPVYLRHAKDGEELFVRLKEAIPDLLFLDIEMPCKDGMACILEIRRNPEYNFMPVIMFTSHNRQSFIEESYQNGANYFLLKSSTVKALTEKLELILSKEWRKQLYFPPRNEYVLQEEL